MNNNFGVNVFCFLRKVIKLITTSNYERVRGSLQMFLHPFCIVSKAVRGW